MANDLSAEQIQKINDAILAGRKIEAIKLYREATGRDLKDSKDFVDSLEAEIRRTHPEKLAAKGKGCLVTIALVVVIVGAVVGFSVMFLS